jgi:hypothetical protein
MYVVLCDFLAGSSIDELASELDSSNLRIEWLLRTALFAYGFESRSSQPVSRTALPISD